MRKRNDACAKTHTALHAAIMNTHTIRTYGINKDLNPIRIKH